MTRPGAVRLQVADLSRSLGFYTGVLGLSVLERSPSRAALAGHGGGRALVSLVGKPGARPVPRGGRFGLFHFAILLPDRPSLARLADHLARHGISFGASDHLVSEALYLTDPDGLAIEVYADRPRETWRYRDGQLLMTTTRLDMDDLAAAAGDTAWNGAPEGTRIGHIHLHVGDLSTADAFYGASLGFEKTVTNYPGALFFAAGGYHHHLGTNTWSPGPAASEDEARLIDWQLLLPDGDSVDAAAERIRGSGYSVLADDRDRIAIDPWGTRLRLSFP